MSDDRETVRQGQGRPTPPAKHDRYQPVREIARGGMGRVVEAMDTKLARTVAVKEVLDQHPDARARFEREVEITARLEHPSIVPLYDSGTSADGTPFYVMRKVSGEPLDAKIRAAASLDQRLRLLPNVLALADAVAHAHARGVIHRDLKPANVLVGTLGETVVIDWGLAKLIGEHDTPLATTSHGHATVAGDVFGTPGFMAPEQVAGEPVDERADVYALGACLYHVLAGRAPFHGSSETEVFERTKTSAPEPIRGGAPPDLITIVEKAMARDKAARYLDAGGFSEDLRRFLNGQLVAAHHYALHTRLARWLRRHRALVAVAAIALVALVAVGVYSLRRIQGALEREHRRADDLLVFKASAYIDSDPTLAAASLQQLAGESDHWRGLGSMVAAIQVHGVAWGYKNGSEKLHYIDPAPRSGDERVIVSSFGVARLHDLAAHTSRLLAEGPEVVRARWCGAHVVVYRKGGQQDWIDPMTDERSAPPWPQKSLATCTDDGTILFIEGGQLVALDPTTRARTAVAAPPDVVEVSVSRSGGWVAVVAKSKLVLYRANQRREYAEAMTIEPASMVAFDAGEHRFAYQTDEALVELDLDPPAPRERRRWETKPIGLINYFGGALHRWRVNRQIDLFDETGEHAIGMAHGLLVEVELDGRRATLIDDSHIAVGSWSERYVLRPSEPVDSIGATRDGRFIVAVSAATTFAWRVTDIASRRSTVSAADSLTFVGNSGLLAFTEDPRGSLAVRYDISRDLAIQERVRGPQPLSTRMQSFIDGVVVMFDSSTSRATVLEPARVPIDLPDVIVVNELDATAFVVATRDGVLHRVDRATGKPSSVVAKLDFAIASVGVRDGTVVALSSKGDVWRRDARGRETRTKLGDAWVSSVLDPDGTLFVGRGNEMLAWSDGEPAVVATFPRPLVSPALRFVSRDEVLVVTEGGALYRWDRHTKTTSLVLPSSQMGSMCNGTLGVFATNGSIALVDAHAGRAFRWLDQITLLVGGVAISPDCQTIVASEQRNEEVVIHAWRIAIPDPRAWILAATNAIAPDTAGGAIEWRDL